MTERRIGLLEQHEEFTIDEFRALLSVPDGKLERYAQQALPQAGGTDPNLHDRISSLIVLSVCESASA
jgi:hypothetical protein